jgi:hypothetical protein
VLLLSEYPDTPGWIAITGEAGKAGKGLFSTPPTALKVQKKEKRHGHGRTTPRSSNIGPGLRREQECAGQGGEFWLIT